MVKNRNTKSKRAARKKKFIELFIEFLKLQLAGNIPFWGTYLLFALFDQVMAVDAFSSLLVATVIANVLFFVVDDRWVFKNSRKHRKTATEVWRFIAFMSVSSLFTFNITWQLYQLLGITPYIGQFISAVISTLLTFIGLRFWVFAPTRRRKAPSKQRRQKLSARL